MGWISMSERDLQRIEVLTDILSGKRTLAAAGAVLALSERQMMLAVALLAEVAGSGVVF